MIHRRKQ
jgi:hypothetical protein